MICSHNGFVNVSKKVHTNLNLFVVPKESQRHRRQFPTALSFVLSEKQFAQS